MTMIQVQRLEIYFNYGFFKSCSSPFRRTFSFSLPLFSIILSLVVVFKIVLVAIIAWCLGGTIHRFLSKHPIIQDAWHESSIRFKGINFLDWTKDAALAACSSCMCFFGGEGSRNNSGNIGRSDLETSRKFSFSGRGWTNTLLMIIVLFYIAQIATQGKLLVWGAKINSLIDQGQLWRLATSSVLHANIGHLMVNCYSLNFVGPAVESISGPRRYLAIYISAIASSAMSCWLSKAPAVGASGANFGLVGSFVVFVLRHRGMVRGGKEDLQHIAHILVLNMMTRRFGVDDEFGEDALMGKLEGMKDVIEQIGDSR